ncbi:MAG TPA: Fe-S protein assembly co-chaperone HscB [Noviherbaspirillum sp.]|uniref:Fe-S protein assembly co-chaperone HscB n=1 Tax=Noviherbaspirillum sp. TaxID=1926288 RepID=UPI002B4A33AF|nr:Fe-S protein assembly co-chaperone HscB [Noviherbaspirillum sp.]HJV88248.1 Fe-S protein assembly co-chaperone HscB [Noviherbaspirillum sp.]
MQNHFELFQLPQGFTIDLTTLEKAYREVQNRVHPDKFSHATDAEKRVAMQWATRANEAYQTLKSPFRRAAYLCELNGIDLQVESNTAMPREFLMQQMEWREALEEARHEEDINALENLEAELREVRKAKVAHVGARLDAQDFEEAARGVRQLMFLEKFGEEVQAAFEKIEG